MPDFFDELGYLPISEAYTPQDRYHDFRRLFMGSDEGKRVFREMLSWGRLFRTAAHGTPIDPLQLAIREGERNFALRLLNTVYNEPQQQPTQTRKQHG